jgi:hypothetical protein
MANCGFDHHLSFLTMKAMKTPRVCKLRKKCFTGFDQCAMVISKIEAISCILCIDSGHL